MALPSTTTSRPFTSGLSGEGRPDRAGLVRRDRLISRLAHASDTPVLMLVAPAGYGKSTLLADWTRSDPRPCAWLSLDERHNDPAVLLGSIIVLLDRIEPVPDDVIAPLTTPRSGVSSVVIPRLEEALREREEPFVLVLDDLHLIDEKDHADLIVAIAHALPAGSQMAIATRSSPRLH